MRLAIFALLAPLVSASANEFCRISEHRQIARTLDVATNKYESLDIEIPQVATLLSNPTSKDFHWPEIKIDIEIDFKKDHDGHKLKDIQIDTYLIPCPSENCELLHYQQTSNSKGKQKVKLIPKRNHFLLQQVFLTELDVPGQFSLAIPFNTVKIGFALVKVVSFTFQGENDCVASGYIIYRNGGMDESSREALRLKWGVSEKKTRVVAW